MENINFEKSEEELKTEEEVEVDIEKASPLSDWQNRHREQEQRKEDIRKRIHNAVSNQERAKECFIPAKPTPSVDDGEHKTVAVYARVSTSSEEQISSIENQTLYYTKKIENEPNWELQEIYSDEGKSGTSMRHRDEFKRMLENAKKKQFDMIICASVSRFARNVSDCLEQVAALKTMNPSHPIGVYFETENIYTLNSDSDQALGLHALLADWESANKSRRMILSYDQRILTGQYPVADLLGYRHTKDGNLIIEKEEAKTVRFIFLAFIQGYDCEKIAEILTEKNRLTMRGRNQWNRDMVINVMQNERRWGELEARKTIVVDYKHGKTAKNNNLRCSAYVTEHHEAIVSPEIARAAKYLFKSSLSSDMGIPDTKVISVGSLKGFVGVNPAWSGINNDAFHHLCRSVYTNEEIEKLHQYMNIFDGIESNSIENKEFSGFQVPYGIGYLTQYMPSLTISKKYIQFNKSCHKKFDECNYIEIYYHPIMQTIIIRKADENTEGAVNWGNKGDREIKPILAKAFCEAVYENMCWKKDYKFRLRGITKERNGVKIMLFFLDEPQIILGRKQRQQLDKTQIELLDENMYIPYKENVESDKNSDVIETEFGYPEEWNHSIGISYELKAMREISISKITAEDINAEGVLMENPIIGHIPTKHEIKEEVEEILMSM